MNEDGNYVVDTSENYTEGRQYYHRVIPVVIEGIDKISIAPTGSSGRKYNNHDGVLVAQNDI